MASISLHNREMFTNGKSIMSDPNTVRFVLVFQNLGRYNAIYTEYIKAKTSKHSLPYHDISGTTERTPPHPTVRY